MKELDTLNKHYLISLYSSASLHFSLIFALCLGFAPPDKGGAHKSWSQALLSKQHRLRLYLFSISV